MINSKWKNYGLWLSIAALLPMLAQATGMFKVPDNYNELVNAVLSILVGFGVISNPSLGQGYSDVKSTENTTTNQETK